LFYNRWGFHHYNPYLNTMVLFVLVGLWHAANAYWVLWGFLHGVFMCCFLIWRNYNKTFSWLPFRGTTISLRAARTFTFLVVCSAWYLPSKILQRLSL
jgi:alginate O-acetyltransferase complex protein AlgI